VVGLLFKTHLGSAQRDPLARFRCGDHTDFDESIDNTFGPFEVLDVQLTAKEALFSTDFLAYRSNASETEPAPPTTDSCSCLN
jgi:hypothetical protein